MAEFYSARGWEIPPLPWTNLSPPFSMCLPNDENDAMFSSLREGNNVRLGAAGMAQFDLGRRSAP